MGVSESAGGKGKGKGTNSFMPVQNEPRVIIQLPLSEGRGRKRELSQKFPDKLAY